MQWACLWGISGSDLQMCVVMTGFCQLRHDPMEHGPTEPHAERSTFLLSAGGAGGGVGITEWPLIRGLLLLRTSFPAGR